MFWVADYFALMNNKMGGDINKIQDCGALYSPLALARPCPPAPLLPCFPASLLPCGQAGMGPRTPAPLPPRTMCSREGEKSAVGRFERTGRGRSGLQLRLA